MPKDLNSFDKFLIGMVAKFSKDEKAKEVLIDGYDFVKKENINDLVTALKNSMGNK